MLLPFERNKDKYGDFEGILRGKKRAHRPNASTKKLKCGPRVLNKLAWNWVEIDGRCTYKEGGGTGEMEDQVNS